MLLKGIGIKKEYGIQQVLDIEKLEIWEGDRIGLVGPNGAGKSTLLHILYGDGDADEGVITRNCPVAMIPQDGEAYGEAAGQMVSRMGLAKSAVKSGGEKTRMAIAAAFSAHAPLLFADEPTTNLDVEGIRTLEKMLCGYQGALVLISHDRELLDRVCTSIWELEEGNVRVFPGNYTAWYEERRREREFAMSEYEKYRSEKKRLEKNVAQIRQQAKTMTKPPKHMGSSEWTLYKGTASIQQGHVQSRGKAIESRLEHMEKKEKPKELPAIAMTLGASHPIKAKVTARIKNLTVEYDGNEVLHDVSLEIPTGERTFLIGPNGSGKTTLIRHLVSKGEHSFVTEGVKIGYFSQEHDTLDWNKTVLENVRRFSAVPESIDRAVLANLYMKERDIHKKVSVLSGGERVKTALAQILVSECNFMILDEPTNHMDIYTMEALEELLKKWKGTMLVVSHDRKLAENLADRVVRMEELAAASCPRS